MSKYQYQPRVTINNPPKTISDDVNAQFFAVLRNGDVDEIRDFILKYKVNFNIVERSKKTDSKNKVKGSKKTPVHVV